MPSRLSQSLTPLDACGVYLPLSLKPRLMSPSTQHPISPHLSCFQVDNCLSSCLHTAGLSPSYPSSPLLPEPQDSAGPCCLIRRPLEVPSLASVCLVVFPNQLSPRLSPTASATPTTPSPRACGAVSHHCVFPHALRAPWNPLSPVLSLVNSYSSCETQLQHRPSDIGPHHPTPSSLLPEEVGHTSTIASVTP